MLKFKYIIKCVWTLQRIAQSPRIVFPSTNLIYHQYSITGWFLILAYLIQHFDEKNSKVCLILCKVILSDISYEMQTKAMLTKINLCGKELKKNYETWKIKFIFDRKLRKHIWLDWPYTSNGHHLNSWKSHTLVNTSLAIGLDMWTRSFDAIETSSNLTEPRRNN